MNNCEGLPRSPRRPRNDKKREAGNDKGRGAGSGEEGWLDKPLLLTGILNSNHKVQK